MRFWLLGRNRRRRKRVPAPGSAEGGPQARAAGAGTAGAGVSGSSVSWAGVTGSRVSGSRVSGAGASGRAAPPGSHRRTGPARAGDPRPVPPGPAARPEPPGPAGPGGLPPRIPPASVQARPQPARPGARESRRWGLARIAIRTAPPPARAAAPPASASPPSPAARHPGPWALPARPAAPQARPAAPQARPGLPAAARPAVAPARPASGAARPAAPPVRVGEPRAASARTGTRAAPAKVKVPWYEVAMGNRTAPGWRDCGVLETVLHREWGDVAPPEAVTAVNRLADLPLLIKERLITGLDAIHVGGGGVPDLDDMGRLSGVPLPSGRATWDACAGAYGERKIVVGSRPSPTPDVMCHEVGHALDDIDSPPGKWQSDSAEFRLIYDQCQPYVASDFHRQRGGLGRKEFFADAFAAIASAQRPALVDMLSGNTRMALRVMLYFNRRYGI
jgi:hypothetical protein